SDLRARPRLPVGFHSARRGNEPDPAGRRLGLEPRLRGLPRLAAPAAVAVPRIGESLASPASPAALPRENPGHVPLARRLADLSRARDHGDDADGGHRADDSDPERALRHGTAPRDRRLRHGLLVAQRVAAVSDRYA